MVAGFGSVGAGIACKSGPTAVAAVVAGSECGWRLARAAGVLTAPDSGRQQEVSLLEAELVSTAVAAGIASKSGLTAVAALVAGSECCWQLACAAGVLTGPGRWRKMDVWLLGAEILSTAI